MRAIADLGRLLDGLQDTASQTTFRLVIAVQAAAPLPAPLLHRGRVVAWEAPDVQQPASFLAASGSDADGEDGNDAADDMQAPSSAAVHACDVFLEALRECAVIV